MSYRVIQCQIAQDNLIHDYCDSTAQKAKLLYNAALFRIRQIFTGWDKDSRTDNEKEVFAEVDLLQQTYPSIKVKRVISYCHLEKLMRVTHNPDFFAGLPMQTAQAVVKHAVTDFSNWLKSLKAYKQTGLDTGKVESIDNVYFESTNWQKVSTQEKTLAIFSHDEILRQNLDFSKFIPLSTIGNISTFYAYKN